MCIVLMLLPAYILHAPRKGGAEACLAHMPLCKNSELLFRGRLCWRADLFALERHSPDSMRGHTCLSATHTHTHTHTHIQTHALLLTLVLLSLLCDSRAHREWFYNRDQRSPEATLWYHYHPRKVERLRATGFVFLFWVGCGDHAVFRGNVVRNANDH